VTDVFLDTVGLIAIWDQSDQWHAQADTAYNRLLADTCRLITTDCVLLECGNAAARRPYRTRVNALRLAMMQEGLLIVPEDADLLEAWDAYDRGDAATAGIVDHVSFVVMRRLGITDAFTNDYHFQAAGFTTLF